MAFIYEVIQQAEQKHSRLFSWCKRIDDRRRIIGLVFRSFPTLHATWLTYQAILEAMHEQNIQKFSDILGGYSPLRNDMDTAISTFSKNLADVLESLRSPCQTASSKVSIVKSSKSAELHTDTATNSTSSVASVRNWFTHESFQLKKKKLNNHRF